MSAFFAIALIVGSTSAAAIALIMARFLRIDRLLARWTRPPATTGCLVEQLAEIAETARREGLLIAERLAVVQGDALLRAGMALVIEGKDPATVRACLEERAGGRHSSSRQVSAPHLVQAASITALVALLLAIFATGAEAGWMSLPAALLAWFGLCAGLVGVSVAGAECDLPSRSRLGVAMRLETIVLIASGGDGNAVRVMLGGWLPAPAAEGLARAA